jgi:hypothetical protein
MDSAVGRKTRFLVRIGKEIGDVFRMSQPIMKIVSVQDCLMTALKFRRRKFAQIGSLKQFFDGRMRFSAKNANLEFWIDFFWAYTFSRGFCLVSLESSMLTSVNFC